MTGDKEDAKSAPLGAIDVAAAALLDRVGAASMVTLIMFDGGRVVLNRAGSMDTLTAEQVSILDLACRLLIKLASGLGDPIAASGSFEALDTYFGPLGRRH